MIARLTPIEHDYVQALLDGYTTDAELSQHLGVDLNDVIKAMRTIYHKTGLTNRAQVILIALESGMRARAKHTEMRVRVIQAKG